MADQITFRLPRHIAIVTKGKHVYAEKHSKPIQQVYDKSNLIILSTIKEIVRLNIPIATFYLLSTRAKELPNFSDVTDSLADFFSSLCENNLVVNNKIKISFIGKWYDFPGKLVNSIKRVIDKTKDYDSFFVNFCINYDGQQEIVDAVKLIAMQIRAGKLDPDLIIINGSKRTSDLLLWDSSNAKVYFTNKLWPDFDKLELMDAIREYQKGE